MKAVIAKGYGAPEVLELVDSEKPKPKKKEVLIKVYAASLNSGDVRMRALDAGAGIKGFVGRGVISGMFGLTKPRGVLGNVLAGEVVEVGASVSKFKVGDEVIAMTGLSFGAFAEYCSLPDKRAIALKPKRASFEQAAALPFGGNTSLYFLHKAGIQEAKKVLIWGSTGAVGSSAVQVAKNYGAEVTAVSGPDGMKMTEKLGASKIYDYTKTSLKDIHGTFDIVFDAVGKLSKKQAQPLLAERGTYVTVNSLDVAKEVSKDLKELSHMYDKGILDACIDRTYPMKDIVEASRYVDSGRKKGNVVIRMNKN